MWRCLCLVAAASAGAPEELWSAAPQGGPDGALLRVDVLFRHGQRVPRAPYPTDPHANATLWDDGPSQLTAEGRRQGYALGVGLRRRYGFLLPPSRAWRAVRAESSQIPRTMMTAAVVLAGLLPPRAPADRWSGELAWQPAPVYTRAPELDNVLGVLAPCPRLRRITDEHDRPSRRVRRLRRYLSERTGTPVRSAFAVQKLYTCLEIEREVGLEPPAWAREVFPEPMRSEAGRALGRSALTAEGARLRAGPLLRQLATFEADEPGPATRLLATHDTVLAGLLQALGLYAGEPPGFAAAAALEYRRAGGGVHVQLWWRPAAGEPLRRLGLPGCGERCPLENFTRAVRPLIPRDWEGECSLSPPPPPPHEALEVVAAAGRWLIFGLAASCSVLLFVALGYALLRRREYESLPDETSSNISL